MPKYLLYISIIVPSVLVCLGVVIYLYQEYLIFYPEKLSEKHIFKFNQPFEEFTIQTPDKENINVLMFKAENAKGLVYYHHGNAGSLEHWGLKAIDFTSRGYDVLMYDYRGFGKSTGKIKNERMLYKDAVLIYNEIEKRYRFDKIIFYGISLGSGIAAKLAHELTPNKLILETPYFNFYDVSKFHYPYLPNSILLHYQFKTNKWLPEIKVPIHLIHGTEDETVPYEMSVRLKKLGENIDLCTIEYGSHNNLNTFEEYQKYLDKVLN